MFQAAAIPPKTGVDTRPLAYIARVYSTDMSITTSYAVFVNDLTGKHPRRITEPADGYDSVAWVGRNRLVWRKSSGDVTELWTAASPYKTPKMIASAKDIRFAMPEAFVPNSGRPIFQVGDDNSLKWVDTTTGDLVPAAATKYTVRDMLATPNPAGKPYQFQGSGEGEFNLSVAVTSDGTDNTAVATATKGDQSTELTYTDNLAHLVWDDKRGNVFFVGWQHDSTLGSRFSLTTFDWPKGALRTICSDVSEFDFWPARNAYACVTIKALHPLDDQGHQVWTNEIWLGDWVKGTKHKVLGGLADYVSVALRGA